MFINLVDHRQKTVCLFALAPMNLVDADGVDRLKLAMGQTPLDEPFYRVVNNLEKLIRKLFVDLKECENNSVNINSRNLLATLLCAFPKHLKNMGVDFDYLFVRSHQ